MVARFNKNRLVYSTGIKILPDHWDSEDQVPKLTGKHVRNNDLLKEELGDYSLQLDLFRTEFNRIFRNMSLNQEPHTVEVIKEELDKSFKKNETTSSKKELFQFIEHFIKTASRKQYTLKGYKTTQKHLMDFKETYSRKIDFDTIDLDFYEDFTKYFNDQKYSLNTIGKNIKNLKVFMNEATDRGLNTNLAYRNKRFKVPQEDTDQIYLSENEIKKIHKKSLKKFPRLEKVRDLFVVACYTGLRYADFSQIKKENIVNKGRVLKIKTYKTGEVVEIPIHWMVKEILINYDYDLPTNISNQKMNDYLKEIGEKAKINEDVPITKTIGGRSSSETFKKYQLITAHTARRSFATNMYLAKVDVPSIMKITGHRTEKSFMKYIRISGEENANLLLNHKFFKRH